MVNIVGRMWGLISDKFISALKLNFKYKVCGGNTGIQSSELA